MKTKPNTVELHPKVVIEKQLLAALDDKSKVAILCTEEDIDLLIKALRHLPVMHKGPGYLGYEETSRMHDGLVQLKREAFE